MSNENPRDESQGSALERALGAFKNSSEAAVCRYVDVSTTAIVAQNNYLYTGRRMNIRRVGIDLARVTSYSKDLVRRVVNSAISEVEKAQAVMRVATQLDCWDPGAYKLRRRREIDRDIWRELRAIEDNLNRKTLP